MCLITPNMKDIYQILTSCTIRVLPEPQNKGSN